MNHTPTIKSYIIGFILSVLLTLIAFTLTFIHINSYHETIPHSILIPAIIGLAVVQLVVQLIFFLHLWQEQNPRWNLAFLVMTTGTILLVVIASIWIMGHLNRNMTPTEMTKFILKDEGIHH